MNDYKSWEILLSTKWGLIWQTISSQYWLSLLDLRSLGQNPSEESVCELLEEFDFNGDGAIDFEEFLLLMAEQMAKPGKYLSNNSSQ